MVLILEKTFENLVNIVYDDITPSLSNGTQFIVDGDMLLINAMADKNYSQSCGGQLLHLIYLCERRLRFFVQKDGVFQIVFFRKWYQLWKEFPVIQLARMALITHFKHNMSYSVYEFDSVWHPKFKQHLNVSRPPFILMDLNFDHYPDALPVKLIFLAETLFTLSSSVLCIDLNGLKLDISTLIAFSATPKFTLKSMLLKHFRKVVNCIESSVNESLLEPTDHGPDPLLEFDLDKYITLSTAVSMLQEHNVSHDLIRLYLVYSAVKRWLPLTCRGFSSLKTIPIELSSFVSTLHKKMSSAVCEAVNCGVNMTHIADIWQGNLFASILIMLSTSDTSETSIIWSNSLGNHYKELVAETCERAKTSLSAFPVIGGHVKWLDELESVDSLVQIRLEMDEMHEKFPVSCSVLEQFCNDSLLRPLHLSEREMSTVMKYYKINTEFDEIRHYHSRRPLTDEVDRTPNSWNSGKSADPREQRKIDRSNHMFVRFLEKYGMNMEGNVQNPRTIVCVQNQKSKNSQKKDKKSKVSSSGQRIITAKKEVDNNKREAEDINQVQQFNKQFKNMMTASEYSKAECEADRVLQRLNMQQSKCKVLLCKAEIYYKKWAEICSAKNKQDLTYAKKLFLTLKTVLKSLVPKKKMLTNSEIQTILQLCPKETISLPHSDFKAIMHFAPQQKKLPGSELIVLVQIMLSENMTLPDDVLKKMVLIHLPKGKSTLLNSDLKIVIQIVPEGGAVFPGCDLETSLKLVPKKFSKLPDSIVKAILQLIPEETVTLPDSDLKNIAKWLIELGFDEVVRKLELPLPHRTRTDLTTGMSSVEFQLEHLGPELDCDTSGVPDSRVEGFVPDEWQRKLFDIVDNRQSALVVAPTSSGKTYASYYCMESVLRESNDGIAVYVSPTKALVSQVHASIYARFKNKSMPPGKAVCGVFTREYQYKAMECQILVTVPQCLELLLLSARRHDWVLRLRYVILDEIHCLAGQAGGISWERCLLMIRCPFLALSATIGGPERFHQWLQNVENFKAERDAGDNITRGRDSYSVKLVTHTDRHADLIKYVYLDGEFKQVHPYAFVDDTIAAREQGIPDHITLSPSETLQLYKVMSSVENNLDIPEPDIFFSSSDSGFLARSLVRIYEQQLKAKLTIWASNDPEKYQEVHEQLSFGLDIPAESDPKEIVIKLCNELAFTLKQKEMLPALIFSYSRNIIEVACLSVTEECKKLVIAKATQKQSKFEEREQRKALEKQEKIPKSYEIKSLDLLEGQGFFRKKGTVDHKDLEFVEKRLLREGMKSNSVFIEGLRQGVSYHHGGLSRIKKSAVEMMFRLKVLNLVYATGTLALGIHMPCRTVVLAGDSQYINSLEYHQMSGRAGRRGYDIYGNVVFMGLGHRKIKTLLTDNFPAMKGNFPLSVGTVLRLLLLSSRVTSRGVQSDAVTQDALSRVLTLLNCSMVYEDNPEMKQQMKFFFAFSTLLLMLQGFVDRLGSPQMLSSIVTHLHYHEPGNLAFVFLFRTGVLRKLCGESKGAISKQTQLDLVLVLSYLFAHMPLHSNMEKAKFRNSVVRLPKLPAYVKECLQEYNKQVKFVFRQYFQSVSRYCEETMGSDNKLPLSGIDFSSPVAELTDNSLESRLAATSGDRTICSSFAALSGNTDGDLYNETQLISNIRHQVFTDMKVVPLVDLDTTLNGYAWDFYNHGIVSAIVHDNKLKSGSEFDKIRDFMLVLKAITVTLEDLEPCDSDDPVVRTFRTVTDRFVDLIRKGFGGGA
ncbi:probable ATP-dependent RNA helicase DDX60 isoform X2 [Bacillus rossius redtenbacheri]